jgi:hypothetical protein
MGFNGLARAQAANPRSWANSVEGEFGQMARPTRATVQSEQFPAPGSLRN